MYCNKCREHFEPTGTWRPYEWVPGRLRGYHLPHRRNDEHRSWCSGPNAGPPDPLYDGPPMGYNVVDNNEGTRVPVEAPGNP